MAMKLKKGVTVNPDGTINIGSGVQGVSTATQSAVQQRNANIIPPAPAIVPTGTTPQAPTMTPTAVMPKVGGVVPTPLKTQPMTPTGVSGNLPGSSSAQNWAVVGKQSDPNAVSTYLNSQPGFKTTVSGNTVTGTKNGEQKTWIFSNGDWIVKPAIATSENPIVSVPDATIDKPTPIETTQMTPDQLKAKYLEISSKLPGEVTDEDRRFINTIKARMSLGETSEAIFGTGTSKSSGTTTYSQELVQPGENIATSTKNADGTYTVTYKDGTTQQTSSKPSETVFPEGTPEYYAQKQAEESQKQIDTLNSRIEEEKVRREEETKKLVEQYGADIGNRFAEQKKSIEEQGAKRMDTLNTGLSFSGFGRSTMALDKRDEIAANIQATVNQAKAKADLELAIFEAERRGADEEAISGMREGVAKIQAQIDDANYKNQLAIIEMNQANNATSDEAMMNLLNTLSSGAEISADADLDKSRSLGYFVDKQGKVMIDSQGRPIQFEATTSGLDPNQIQAYADAISKGIIKADDLDKTLNPAQKADIMKRVAVDNGTYAGFGAIDVPRNVNGTTNNVGQDTNNPGNIMADSEGQKNYAKSLGAIGFYSSPNGRTYAVFPDMDTGYNAMLKDLEGKINGGSSWATANTTLAKLASGWVSGPNAPTNNAAIAAYVKATGYPANTPIGQIPIETLAKAIYQHEGVDITRNANIPFTGGTGGQGGEAPEMTTSDISIFNNTTYKPQLEKDPIMKKKYQQFLDEKNKVMKNKDANIDEVMGYSQGGKDLTDTDTKTITKFAQALDQIDGITKQINEQKTGPIIGRLRGLNPYDTDAKVLASSLSALIPNLARGVYGEVGVLTDNDIRNYARTVPTLTQTNDVNNAVLALTLDTIAGGYKRQLQTLAAAGKDVSGFAGLYESIKAQADSIRATIPGFNTPQNAPAQNMSMMPGATQTGGATNASDWDF